MEGYKEILHEIKKAIETVDNKYPDDYAKKTGFLLAALNIAAITLENRIKSDEGLL